MTDTRATDVRYQPRPEIGAARRWSFPAVERHTLDNGVGVVLCHLPLRPLTSVQVLVDAPREAEPRELEGVAAITAQAIREGTARHDAEAFLEELERRGATLESGAAHAGLRVGLGVPNSRLEAALGLLTDALGEPLLPGREVERLVRLRLDAIRREQAQPAMRASRELVAAHFDPSERIARPDGGDAETVSRIDRDAVAAFHARHVRPSATTVVVAGDLEGGTVLRTLEATLGGWRGEPAGVHTRRAPATQPQGRVVVVDRPGSAQSELRLTRQGPTRQDDRWGASALAAFTLGGGMMSRLMQTLREERGYTYGIGASPVAQGPAGYLYVGGAVETAVTGPAVELALSVIGRLAAEGVTPEEHRFAVDNLTAAPRRLETPGAVARTVIGALEDGLPEDHFQRYFPRLERTTADEVDAAAALDWRPGLTLVVLGDAAQIADPLRALGVGDVQVIA